MNASKLWSCVLVLMLTATMAVGCSSAPKRPKSLADDGASGHCSSCGS